MVRGCRFKAACDEAAASIENRIELLCMGRSIQYRAGIFTQSSRELVQLTSMSVG